MSIFGDAGTQLWDSVVEVFDFEDEPGKVHLLEQACRVADIIDELDAAANEGPLTVRGSMGQPVISPFISEARSQRSLLHQLLSKLGLPDSDEAQADKADRLSQIRRKAARSGRLSVVVP